MTDPAQDPRALAEEAQIALSFLFTHTETINIPCALFDRVDAAIKAIASALAAALDAKEATKRERDEARREAEKGREIVRNLLYAPYAYSVWPEARAFVAAGEPAKGGEEKA